MNKFIQNIIFWGLIISAKSVLLIALGFLWYIREALIINFVIFMIYFIYKSYIALLEYMEKDKYKKEIK